MSSTTRNPWFGSSKNSSERKLELEIDREFQAWPEMAETEYTAVQDEIAAKARILEQEYVTTAHPDAPRSARQAVAAIRAGREGGQHPAEMFSG